MMKILMLPVKLVILPVMVILYILSLLGRVVTNLSAYIVGPFLLFLLILCGFCLWHHRWTDAVIVAVLEVAILALQFGAMFLTEMVRGWAGRLAGFLLK